MENQKNGNSGEFLEQNEIYRGKFAVNRCKGCDIFGKSIRSVHSAEGRKGFSCRGCLSVLSSDEGEERNTLGTRKEEKRSKRIRPTC